MFVYFSSKRQNGRFFFPKLKLTLMMMARNGIGSRTTVRLPVT